MLGLAIRTSCQRIVCPFLNGSVDSSSPKAALITDSVLSSYLKSPNLGLTFDISFGAGTPLSISFRYIRFLITIDVVLGLFHNPTLIVFEPPRGNVGLKNLVEFFKRSRLCLRDEEVKPYNANEV
jgi:hypothetical protein